MVRGRSGHASVAPRGRTVVVPSRRAVAARPFVGRRLPGVPCRSTARGVKVNGKVHKDRSSRSGAGTLRKAAVAILSRFVQAAGENCDRDRRALWQAVERRRRLCVL